MRKGGAKQLSRAPYTRLFLGIIFLAFIFLFFAYLVRATSEGVIVTSTLPLNNTVDFIGNMTFYYNVTDLNNNVSNCSFFFDAALNQTDITITESIIQSFNLSNIAFGFHNWSVECTNNIGNKTSSEIKILQVYNDPISPVVTLEAPADLSNSSNGDISLNFSVTDNGLISYCDLYANLNGTWNVTNTNYFVQQNNTLSFDLEDIPDETTFKWNVVCYDFTLNPNFDWGDSNRTFTVNNTNPTYSTIPAINMNEDSVYSLNLSAYFSDSDGDDLTYSASSVSNITISIDNNTNIASIEPDLNWYGNRSVIFYAFDDMNGNASSNGVTINVTQQGDTAPYKISTSPSSQHNDSYGVTYITCNGTDDYNMTSIKLYTDIEGNWSITQGEYVNGTTNSVTFAMYTWTESTSYKWGCKFEDNSTHESWSQNYTVNVSIKPYWINDIGNYTINHVNHNRTISVGYSNHLNGTLTLQNLTIFLSNGTTYFSKDLSLAAPTEITEIKPQILAYFEKIRIRYENIFGGNYSINNTEQLNITLNYYYGNNSRQISTIHEIRVASAPLSP